ncbi:MAG: DUF11 domain-containing protein, partial [Tannerella sp.]|nr:DUF11 domain-containing protein [Tannerella sp.]
MGIPESGKCINRAHGNNLDIKKRLLLLFVSLFCVTSFLQATISVDLGKSVKISNYYTFPDLTVTGDPADKGYVIRIMFTRAVNSNDKVTLPTLLSGWSLNSISTNHVRVIDIAAGASPADMQSFLRNVKTEVDAAKKGHGVMFLISESAVDAGRSVFYSADTDNWYEYINNGSGLTWVEAYNNSLDAQFLGHNGYLVTVTSYEEDEFIKTLISKNSWMGGTRLNITPYLNAITGKLENVENPLSIPAVNLLDYWYWASGPEWEDNGKDPTQSVFYRRRISTEAENTSVTLKYNYTNWNGNEPNSANAYESGNPVEETCAHFYGSGKWNDFKHNNTTVETYVVEYSGITAGASILLGFNSEKDAAVNGTSGNGTATSPVNITLGDVITYTINAVNASETSTTVMVIDTLPAGLDLIMGSITAGGTYNASTRIITWSLTIPLNGSANVSFQAEKTFRFSGHIINTAAVTSGGTLTSHTNKTYHQGFLSDSELPDNISSADCFINPPAREWGIAPKRTTLQTLSTYQIPIAGDIDGDGIVEILVAGGVSLSPRVASQI